MSIIGAEHSDEYADAKELKEIVEKCLELSITDISYTEEVKGNHKYNITHIIPPKLKGQPRKVRHSYKREQDQSVDNDKSPNGSPDKKRLKKDIVAEAVLETIEKREDTVIIEAPEFVLPGFVGEGIDDDSVSNEVELQTEMAEMDKENAEKYKNDYVRGLRGRNNPDKKIYDYCSYKCLMEVKEKTKDVFVINIPPPGNKTWKNENLL